MWLIIRRTGAASVLKATMRTVAAIRRIAAILVPRASVRSGSVTARSRTPGAERPVGGR
jgi:hypothetical protein